MHSDTLPHLYMQYESIGALDPCVLHMASCDGLVVTANNCSVLHLLKDGTRHFLYAHYGGIVHVEIQLDATANPNSYLVVCATAPGFIYVHRIKIQGHCVICRVACKWRLGSQILGLGVSESFSKNMSSSLKTKQTLDMCKLVQNAKELDWDQKAGCKRYKYLVCFALSNGGIYSIAAHKHEHLELCVNVLDAIKPKSTQIKFAWRRNLVAWSHADGVQVYSLESKMPIAFVKCPNLVHPRDVVNSGSIDTSTVAEIVANCDQDKMLNTPTESSCESDNENGPCECSRQHNYSMQMSIISHSMCNKHEAVLGNISKSYLNLAWIDAHQLVIGCKDIVQGIEIVPADGTCLKSPYLPKSNRWRYLMCTRTFSRNWIPKRVHANKKISYRGYLAFKRTLPGCRIQSIEAGSNASGTFSILCSIVDENLPHHHGMHEIKKIQSTPFNKWSDTGPRLRFGVFDSCLEHRDVTISNVSSLLHANKCQFCRTALVQFVCKFQNHRMDTISKQHLTIYSFMCSDYRNFEHCLLPNLQTSVIMPFYTAQYCDNAPSLGGPLDIVTSVNLTDGNSGTIMYLACRNSLVAISACTLKEYILQLCKHQLYPEAMEHLSNCNDPECIEEMMVKVLDEGLYCFFACPNPGFAIYPAMHLALVYIKLIDSFNLGETNLRRLVLGFAMYGKLGLLMSYMFSDNSCMPPVVLDTIVEADPSSLVLLRLVAFGNLDAPNAKKIACKLTRLVLGIKVNANYNSKALVDCSVPKYTEPDPEYIQFLNEVACKCSKLEFDPLKQQKGTPPPIDNCSDFEILQYFLQGKGSFYNQYTIFTEFQSSQLGPHARAALLALGMLLFRFGHLPQSLECLILSQFPLALKVANLLCELGHGELVLGRIKFLFSINPEMACRLCLDYFNDSIDDIKLAHSEQWHMLLVLLYEAGALSNEYQCQLLKSMCMHDPIGFLMALQQSDWTLDHNICRELLQCIHNRLESSKLFLYQRIQLGWARLLLLYKSINTPRLELLKDVLLVARLTHLVQDSRESVWQIAGATSFVVEFLQHNPPSLTMELVNSTRLINTPIWTTTNDLLELLNLYREQLCCLKLAKYSKAEQFLHAWSTSIKSGTCFNKCFHCSLCKLDPFALGEVLDKLKKFQKIKVDDLKSRSKRRLYFACSHWSHSKCQMELLKAAALSSTFFKNVCLLCLH
ncbi:hypothetical protein BdWA1_000707 [Babesia duncani]|uniref:Uncharacterized protein n=1 Tax=Babesia duncani TaxID=323732 RepID=A0AAD9PMW6_9APIC|nr:hypothetical protein BdWA1_000707 [Babesia duncani]